MRGGRFFVSRARADDVAAAARTSKKLQHLYPRRESGSASGPGLFASPASRLRRSRRELSAKKRKGAALSGRPRGKDPREWQKCDVVTSNVTTATSSLSTRARRRASSPTEAAFEDAKRRNRRDTGAECIFDRLKGSGDRKRQG